MQELVKVLTCSICKFQTDKNNWYRLYEGLMCIQCGCKNEACQHNNFPEDCIICQTDKVKPFDYALYPEDLE